MKSENGIKKILYIDMDNVLVDFPSGVSKLSKEKKGITFQSR